MANEIEIEIVARLDSVDKSIKSLESKAEKAGKKIGKDLGEGLADSVGSSFNKMAAAATAAIAAIGSAFALGKVIAAAQEQEAAIHKMNQALANAGTFSEAASKKIIAFGEEMQRTTAFEGDAIVGLVGLARNFTHTNEEATKLTQAAMELSSATGISLDTAVENLGKSLSGVSGRLAQTIPQVKNLTEEQLKAGAAIDVVLQRYGGSAASQINTFGGAISQLKNIFGDLLETLGDMIIQSPIAREAIKFVSGEILKLTKSIADMAGKDDVFGQLILKLVEFSLALNEFVVAPLELATNGVKVFFNGFMEVIQTFVAGMAMAASAITGLFAPLGGKFAEIDATVKLFEESSTAVLSDFSKKTQESMGQIFNFDVAASGANFLERFKTVLMSAQKATKDFSNNVNKDITKSLEKTFDVGAAFANGMSTIFQTLGGVLVDSSKGWSKMAGAILGVLGDLAIQVGTFIITTAIGIKLLKSSIFGPAGAGIAAGVALVVLGGALKAISGKMGGSSSEVSGSTEPIAQGGGGGSADFGSGEGGGLSSGISAPIGESATSLADVEAAKPGTAINVNIAGNVLGDKRTLGRAIADAINESFGSDGTVIARGAIV